MSSRKTLAILSNLLLVLFNKVNFIELAKREFRRLGDSVFKISLISDCSLLDKFSFEIGLIFLFVKLVFCKTFFVFPLFGLPLLGLPLINIFILFTYIKMKNTNEQVWNLSLEHSLSF